MTFHQLLENFFDLCFGSNDYYEEYDYCVYGYKDRLFVSFAFMGSC